MIEVTKNEEKIVRELLKGPVYYAMVHANGYANSFVLEASEKSLLSFIRLMAGKDTVITVMEPEGETVAQVCGYEFTITDSKYREAIEKLAMEMNEGNGIFEDMFYVKFVKIHKFNAVSVDDYEVVEKETDKHVVLSDETELFFDEIPQEKFSRRNLDYARHSMELSIRKYLVALGIDAYVPGKKLSYLTAEVEKCLYNKIF